ncbi:hypothetical protein ACFQV2_10680 [Actinokineospora soli]|uniref:Uncharacterized protein n=1 Tax=Actinokineospora soli TaxID=1048753 RepID=A0ABW2TM96_9PSEU
MRPRDVLGAVAALALLGAAPAAAEPIGGLVITPGESKGAVPVRLTTSAGCPAQTTGYYATMTGPGLSEELVLVSNGDVGLSTTEPFELPVALTFADLAKDNNVVFAGRYTVAVHCIDAFTMDSHGEFTGQLDFKAGAAPGSYVAAGKAKGPQQPTRPLVPTQDQPPVQDGAPSAPAAQPGPQAAPEQAPAAQNAPDEGTNPLVYVAIVVAAVIAVAVGTTARRRATAPADAE